MSADNASRNNPDELDRLGNDHSVSETEAFCYYFGLRGNSNSTHGPRLIYRTSKDIFEEPSGPFQEVRTMKLFTVHRHEKLSENNLWDTVRGETAGILDRNQIKFTSIDLVRFRWDGPIDNDPDGTIISAVTIWIGVLPNTTNSNTAFNLSEEILKLLKGYDINDIEIAFRESVTRPFASVGPILYSPVDDFHPLKGVIDWVTTALSLPIAGLDSPNTEGTLGLYFKVGEDLYGVTARHVLFSTTEGNDDYTYNTADTLRKKSVVLMGTQTFKELLRTVQGNINLFTQRITASGNDVGLMGAFSQEEQKQRDKLKATIVELKKFLETLKTDWSNIKNRIIGHVIWSPSISGLTPGASQGYTRDVCVIKLDKTKILPNLMTGNAVDLGTIIDIGKLVTCLYPQPREHSPDFDYPMINGLYNLKSILPVAEMQEPHIVDIKGHPTRFVFRSGGPTPGTTIGLLNGFLSRARRYTLLGNFDSIEAAVFPYDPLHGPFSQASDSGAAVIGVRNEFVAQITAGAGSESRDLCDITYGTPMEWLWNNVLKPEFPDADLFFEGLSEDQIFSRVYGLDP